MLIQHAPIVKSDALICICLVHYKVHRPDLFRLDARINPDTFDLLTECLKTQSCFHNDSGNEQMPVARQILIALKRLGTYGNGSSLQNIARWAGVGKGTVDLVTRRVLLAIHDSDLQTRHIRWPAEGDPDREEAKDWVEDTGAPEQWSHGWCMVDGTTVPLYEKPHYYGDAFFDRKSQYSINVQIINTPHNNQIIDYASGFNGSRHDSHCFEETFLYEHHSSLLTAEEWCWSDVAYPLRDWLVSPFKKPNNRSKINKKFNYNLSRIRIRSEHAIGYLKGRFSSLKELRIAIRNKKDTRYASAWINACIILHAFAIDEEAYSPDFAKDGYIWEHEERKLDTRRGENVLESSGTQESKGRMLREGKAFRELLKSYL